MDVAEFGTKKDVERLLGITPRALQYWRIGGRDRGRKILPVLSEGIHWYRLNPTRTLYNIPLMRDFIANRGNPEAHQRAIAAYFASLPSAKAASDAGKEQKVAA